MVARRRSRGAKPPGYRGSQGGAAQMASRLLSWISIISKKMFQEITTKMASFVLGFLKDRRILTVMASSIKKTRFPIRVPNIVGFGGGGEWSSMQTFVKN